MMMDGSRENAFQKGQADQVLPDPFLKPTKRFIMEFICGIILLAILMLGYAGHLKQKEPRNRRDF